MVEAILIAAMMATGTMALIIAAIWATQVIDEWSRFRAYHKARQAVFRDYLERKGRPGWLWMVLNFKRKKQI